MQNKANYKDDKPDGISTIWYDNGQKRYEANYKDGKVISQAKWNEAGDEIKK